VAQELNADFMGHCWSPDGRRVAYVWRQLHADGKNDRETESFLMVVGADGKDPATVLSEKAENQGIITLTSPHWR
jgi:Tol biopolymer transport system component